MTDLDHLRQRLDDIDQRILDAITDRYTVIRAIADHKRTHQVPMMQPGRVAYVQDRYAAAADRVGIPAQHLRDIAGILINAACDLEDDLIDGASPSQRE